jgi:hypothetical protein
MGVKSERGPRGRLLLSAILALLTPLVLAAPARAAGAAEPRPGDHDFSIMTAASGLASNNDRRAVGGGVYDRAVGRTYISWTGANADNYVQSYDHATGVWSAPVLAGAGDGDQHNYPVMVLTRSGHVLVFRGMHNQQLFMARSNREHDVTSFTDGPVGPAPAATYPMPIVADNGDVYVFYRETMETVTRPPNRAPTDFRPMQYVVSSDDGLTWTSGQDLFGFPFAFGSSDRPDNENEVYVGQIRHQSAADGRPERFLIVWTLAGGGFEGHAHARFDHNLYFASFTPADRHFHDAAGDDLGTSIIGGAMDACLVVASGYANNSPGVQQLVGAVAGGAPVVVWYTTDQVHSARWNGAGWNVADTGSKFFFFDMQRLSENRWRLFAGAPGGVQTYLVDAGTSWSPEVFVPTPTDLRHGSIITSYTDPARMILEGLASANTPSVADGNIYVLGVRAASSGRSSGFQ